MAVVAAAPGGQSEAVVVAGVVGLVGAAGAVGVVAALVTAGSAVAVHGYSSSLS